MPAGMMAEGVKRQALSGEMFTKSGIGKRLTGKMWKITNA
jgi:hypothetical protein